MGALRYDTRVFIYEVAPPGQTIAYVNDAWLDFAIENGCASLSRENVIGRSLWEFVAGATTRHLYETLGQLVVEQERTAEIHFRCDAPDYRRFMKMRLKPLPHACLRYECRILHEEGREAVSLDAAFLEMDAAMVVMCSVCKKVQRPVDGAWIEVEDAVNQLDLLDAGAACNISHGLCPECYQCALDALV